MSTIMQRTNDSANTYRLNQFSYFAEERSLTAMASDLVGRRPIEEALSSIVDPLTLQWVLGLVIEHKGQRVFFKWVATDIDGGNLLSIDLVRCRWENGRINKITIFND